MSGRGDLQRAGAALLLFGLSACSSSSPANPDSGGCTANCADSGSAPDAGPRDSGTADSGTPDAGTTDAGPTLVTLNGIVLNGPGTPVFGARLVLNDNVNLSTTTASDGTFTFANVALPYTLTLTGGSGVTEYRGLSTTTPRLTSNYIQYTTTIAGTVTGPSFPLPANEAIYVAAKGVGFNATASSTDGTYSGSVYWDTSSSVVTDLVAVHVGLGPSGTGEISSYKEFGTKSGVSLVNGTALSGLDVAISGTVATTTTTIATQFGAYNSGPLATLSAFQIGTAVFTPGGGVTTGIQSGDSFPVPTGGATVQAQGSLQASTGLATHRVPLVGGGTTNVALPASNFLSLISPANGTSGVGVTPTLSWTPVAGATMYTLLVSNMGGTQLDDRFYLGGQSASFTVPDFTQLGFGLAQGGTYRWQILAYVDPSITPSFYVNGGSSYDLTGYATTSSATYSAGGYTFTP